MAHHWTAVRISVRGHPCLPREHTCRVSMVRSAARFGKTPPSHPRLRGIAPLTLRRQTPPTRGRQLRSQGEGEYRSLAAVGWSTKCLSTRARSRSKRHNFDAILPIPIIRRLLPVREPHQDLAAAHRVWLEELALRSNLELEPYRWSALLSLQILSRLRDAA